MRHLVLSDVHGDIRALNSAEAIAQSPNVGGFDDIWFLGDAIGRDSTFDEVDKCLQWLKDRSAICILGNHEWWVLTPELDSTNEQKKLTQDQRFRQKYRDEIILFRGWLKDNKQWDDFIRAWPDHQVQGNVTLVHGSPLLCSVEGHLHCSTPYLEWNEQVEQIFGSPRPSCRLYPEVQTTNLFVGHHHSPFVFYYKHNQGASVPKDPFAENSVKPRIIALAKDGWKTAIRVGTVSHRALRNYPMACAMVYDDVLNTISMFEVVYA